MSEFFRDREEDRPGDPQLRWTALGCTQQCCRPVRLALLGLGRQAGGYRLWPMIGALQSLETAAWGHRLAADEWYGRCSALDRPSECAGAAVPLVMLRSEKAFLRLTYRDRAADRSILNDLNRFQVTQGGQQNSQVIALREVRERLRCRRQVAGEANARSRPESVAAKRQPKRKATSRKPGGQLVRQNRKIGLRKATTNGRLPLPADVVLDLDVQEWVDDCAERLATVAVSADHESVAEVEDRLLPETKLADDSAVGSLAALAERCDSPLVFPAKHPIVRHQEPRTAQQRVFRRRPAWKCVKPEPVSQRIVCVLEQFLENRVSGVVSILKVDLDLIYDGFRGVMKVGHRAYRRLENIR